MLADRYGKGRLRDRQSDRLRRRIAFALTPAAAGGTLAANGSRSEIQSMLEFAARHQIKPQIEQFPMHEANQALDRLRKNDMRYRAVLTN